MDKKRGDDKQGYQQVHGDEDDEERDSREDDSLTQVEEEAGVKSDAPMKKANPTPLPADEGASSGSSGRNTPRSSTPRSRDRGKEVEEGR